MAYRPATISPSSLGYNDLCPGFRSSGESNAASDDGTLYHGHMEKLCALQSEERDIYVEKTEMSNDMRWLVRESAKELNSFLVEKLSPRPNFRMVRRRGTNVFLKTKKLEPGVYTECEVDLGGGRHGYIDCMIVPSDGPVIIIDWKSSRNDHDYSLQIKRYAVAVNDLCPLHEEFICCIVAPRLSAECQLRIPMAKADIEAARAKVREIEERVDRMAVDATVGGHPSDACQFCRWSGQCRFQNQYVDGAAPVLGGEGAYELAGRTMDNAQTGSDEKAAKAVSSSINVFRELTKPGSVFEGTRLTLNPTNPQERGLRRIVMKTMASIFDAVKKDDAKWIADHPGTLAIPGFKIQEQRGKASVPKENESELRAAFVSKYGLTPDEVMDCSTFDPNKVVEVLITSRGYKKTDAKTEVEKTKEPFTVRGANVIKWVASEKAHKLTVESKADEL